MPQGNEDGSMKEVGQMHIVQLSKTPEPLCSEAEVRQDATDRQQLTGKDCRHTHTQSTRHVCGDRRVLVRWLLSYSLTGCVPISVRSRYKGQRQGQ